MRFSVLLTWVAVLILLALQKACFAFVIANSGGTLSLSSRRSELYSAFGSNPRNRKRRQKKNKYAKSQPTTKDPLDLLMEESATKLKELENLKNNSKMRGNSEEIEPLRSELMRFEFPDNSEIDPNDPASFGFIEIGTIVGPHGVHGEVRVKSNTGFPKRFTEPGIKYLKPENKRAPRKVVLVSGKPSKDDEFIIRLDDTTNRDDAKKLRGGTLFVREEDRECGTMDNSLEGPGENDGEEEYFISDLVGLEVFLERDLAQDRTPFVGKIVGVVLAEDMCGIPGLGHDMLEVNLPRGKGGIVSFRDDLVLIPFVPQIVPRVSIATGTVYITPPEGLLDLTYVREEKIRIRGFLAPAPEE